MKYRILVIAVLLFTAVLWSCKEETPVNNDTTTVPQIVSLTADKPEILFGGADPTIITCTATGGELAYKWDVDLGDIFPLNAEGSQVRFTGSPCCLGKKYIKCTVSNDKGSIKDTIIITIKDPVF
ncbi:MAG: hypothetical protein WCR42_10400 [bacterium]